MNELSHSARALLEAARKELTPDASTRQRVRDKIDIEIRNNWQNLAPARAKFR